MKKITVISLIMIFIISLAFMSIGCKARVSEVTTVKEVATDTETTAAETTVAVTTSAKKITLHIWDTFTEENQSAGMDKMISKFQESNPNIEIVREAQTIDDMRPVLQTALASGMGPDIMYYDTGPGYAGVLAKAGLLLELDTAYKDNGWNNRIFNWTKERVTFNGKTYGIGNEVEFIGVYYNKKIFNELGVGEPKTYEEFTQICNKAKAAGYTPIAFADGDKWPAYHQFSIMANNIAGKEKLDRVLFDEGTWNDPDFIKAIQIFFVDMNKAGYFLSDTTAIKYEDGNAVFYSGKAAMHMTGTWLISEITANAKDFETGFFFFPSIEGKPILPPGGLGSGYFISSKTANPVEAIKFLDYLFSEENAKMWLENMSIIPPIIVNTEGLNLSPLMKFAVNAVSGVPLGYNIDVLAGDQFNNTQADGYQAVLLGKKTPEVLIKELQSAWEADKGK
ncbi:MAG: extracellular solute-binding protein [Actinobacteria bacterium]|nr:extracellular solute-binding protein [Cyanobacteriota bacterium]MCL6086922.1 extracellular solute-binding protein [Actinomycetota bacterium]